MSQIHYWEWLIHMKLLAVTCATLAHKAAILASLPHWTR